MTAHTALRASYSIDANVLRRFNDTIPAGERSKIVQSLMEQALLVRERNAAKQSKRLTFAVMTV
jgi:hypothetical protein